MKQKENFSGSGLKRREFIKSAGLAATGLAMAPQMSFANASSQVKKVRAAWIGVGQRGAQIMKTALGIEGVEVVAVCDILEERNSLAQKIVMEAGQPKPEAYGRGPEDWKRLMERNDIDTVICASPLAMHPPVMIACMQKGIIGASELPICSNVDEAWELIEVHEKTGVQFQMLENYIYRRFEQMVYNMAHLGVFGEISHCTSSYMNSSAYIMWDENGKLKWRGEERALRTGNRYPTHATGPAAKWLDICRGDQFDYLVSMGSRSLGLNAYAKRTLGPDHEFSTKDWPLNDVNVTMIKTKMGRSITLIYDAILPRPGEFVHRLQGTKGLSNGTLNSFYIEDRSPRGKWESAESYYEEYDHPNWKKYGKIAAGSTHGGADYLQFADFFKAVRNRSQVTVDPYDAVTWSVLVDLTEESVLAQSRAIAFPDFTRGKWVTRKPLPIEAI